MNASRRTTPLPEPPSHHVGFASSSWLTLALAVGVVLQGCDDGPPAPTEAEREAAREAFDEQLRERAGVTEPATSAWPSEVEALSRTVDTFESFDACVARLRRETPTPVAESLADLAYDGFYEDVCHGIEAARTADETRCEEIEVRTIRAGCERRVALIAGRAEACPPDASTGAREAVCVAWAERQPGLCRAAAGEDAIRCRAVLSREPDGCGALRPSTRSRCLAEIERYGDALGDDRVEREATGAAPVLHLDATVGDAPSRAVDMDTIERGVRLEADGCRYRVTLGHAAVDLGALLPGRAEPSFDLTLRSPPAPGTLPLGPTAAILRLRLPEQGVLSTAATTSEGEVVVTAFEPVRGGALRGTLEGALHPGSTTVRVEGRFSTFIRDLDPLPASCVPRPEESP